jgi:hypothetical protein
MKETALAFVIYITIMALLILVVAPAIGGHS